MSQSLSLAPAEIMALKQGELVDVTWSGGNGPARYFVSWSEYSEVPYAARYNKLREELFLVGPLLASPEDRIALNRVSKTDPVEVCNSPEGVRENGEHCWIGIKRSSDGEAPYTMCSRCGVRKSVDQDAT